MAADNDASQPTSGEAAGLAGAGTPDAGGGPGGTPDAGGLGLPGGARRLGAGAAPARDAREGGAPLTGGPGTSGNAAAGSSEAHPLATPDTESQGFVHGMEHPHAAAPKRAGAARAVEVAGQICWMRSHERALKMAAGRQRVCRLEQSRSGSLVLSGTVSRKTVPESTSETWVLRSTVLHLITGRELRVERAGSAKWLHP